MSVRSGWGALVGLVGLWILVKCDVVDNELDKLQFEAAFQGILLVYNLIIYIKCLFTKYIKDTEKIERNKLFA